MVTGRFLLLDQMEYGESSWLWENYYYYYYYWELPYSDTVPYTHHHTKSYDNPAQSPCFRTNWGVERLTRCQRPHCKWPSWNLNSVYESLSWMGSQRLWSELFSPPNSFSNEQLGPPPFLALCCCYTCEVQELRDCSNLGLVGTVGSASLSIIMIQRNFLNSLYVPGSNYQSLPETKFFTNLTRNNLYLSTTCGINGWCGKLVCS